MSTAANRIQELYAAIEALPRGVTGELIDCQLYAHPRPSARHGHAALNLGADLVNPYSRGRGGPGGWWIIGEPEIHFILDTELCVPDIAGWRRSRMPELPEDQRFQVVPDCICEIASPSTASYDREKKMPLYARYGVAWLWMVDPRAKLLEAFQLENGDWHAIGVFRDQQPICIAPFAEVEVAPPWN